MNRLTPCDHEFPRPRIHTRIAYGVQQYGWDTSENFLEVAYRLRRRAQYRLAAMLYRGLFQRPVMPELGTHGHGWCRVERGVVHQLKQRFGHGMVTLHFPMETPLDEVLKHIKDATKGSDGKRLSIYVDPQRLRRQRRPWRHR